MLILEQEIDLLRKRFQSIINICSTFDSKDLVRLL